MDFDNQTQPQTQPQTQSQTQPLGQSFLGGLLQTDGDDLINYGSQYARTELDTWAQKL